MFCTQDADKTKKALRVHLQRTMKHTRYDEALRLAEPEPQRELRRIAHHEDDPDQDRHAEREPIARPAREFDAFTDIGSFEEIIPAPSTARNAEDHIEQTTQWQQVVGYDEIFDRLDIADARDPHT